MVSFSSPFSTTSIFSFANHNNELQTRIHDPRSAIIALTETAEKELLAAENLAAKLARRGQRVNATIEDILLTREDDAQMAFAFQAPIAEMLVRYCPGAKT